MKRDDGTKFLKGLGSKVPQSQPRSQWVIGDCPLGPWRHDGGKSSPEVFGVKIGPGDSFCSCFSCGYHGSGRDLLMEIRALNKKQPSGKSYPFGDLMQLIADAEATAELDLDVPLLEDVLFGDHNVRKLHPFDEDWLASFAGVEGFPWAEQYLLERNCWPAMWEHLDLRVDTFQKRILFPVRDFSGVLMGLHGRAVDPDDDLRYRMYLFEGEKNPEVWLGEHTVDLDKPIIIAEGPFDYASILRVYRNVVCPLFANPNQAKIKRMSDAFQWITLLDRGKGGDSGRAKISQTLPDHMVTHLKPTEGRKDPGEMTVPELVELLSPYVTIAKYLGA